MRKEIVISKTPLRISFIGGGTDFRNYYERHSGGLVVSTAIDKYVHVIIKRRFDSKTFIHWSHGREVPQTIDDIQHELVRECLKHLGVFGGLEIILFSDIPAHGSGLGSSSSITVGLLNALYCMFDGIKYKAAHLAERASEIEIDILGKPIGKQDQYAAAYGGFNSIRFMPCGNVVVNDHKIPKWTRRHLDNHLLLCYSGVGRSADDILEEQNASVSINLELLDKLRFEAQGFGWCLDALEVVDDSPLPRDSEDRKRQEAEKDSSDMGWVADGLSRSWELKKQLANGVTNPKINELYRKAKEGGAEGGKLCGAGGGGFFLFYVKPENRQRLIDALGLDVYPFTICAGGSEIIFEQ